MSCLFSISPVAAPAAAPVVTPAQVLARQPLHRRDDVLELVRAGAARHRLTRSSVSSRRLASRDKESTGATRLARVELCQLLASFHQAFMVTLEQCDHAAPVFPIRTGCEN